MNSFPARGILDQMYLRDFFDNAPIGFHIFGPDQVIIDINQAELDMIGYDRQEIVGKKVWTDLILCEERSIFKKHWKTLIEKGRVKNIPYTLVHKSGRHVEVLLYATARFDSLGNLINTRGSVVDVTERNQMERTLRECDLELRRQKEALEKNNAALNGILTQIQEEKIRIKENVINNIEHIIRPLMENLNRRGSTLDKRNVELLAQSLDDITGEFGRQLIDRKWKLSRREMEICHMIKNGMSTKEIADMLSVSMRTVDNHRDRIRKKLDVSNRTINLATYLQNIR